MSTKITKKVNPEVQDSVVAEETPATETVKSDAWKARKAMYDAYKKQNPEKYEQKKETFERILATL